MESPILSPHQLIVCGCSWANGAELTEHERPFGYLVAEHLGANYWHQAQDAASIPHMVLQLRSAISTLDTAIPTVALFLLTAPDRDLMWSKTRPIGTGHLRDNSPPYTTYQPIFLNGNDPLHRDWFVEYHSPNLASYRANTSIMVLQSLCAAHGIKDYYAWAFDRVTLWNEINIDRFYRGAQFTMVDEEFAKAKLVKIRHPDQAQHRLMAHRFLAMIQNS